MGSNAATRPLVVGTLVALIAPALAMAADPVDSGTSFAIAHESTPEEYQWFGTGARSVKGDVRPPELVRKVEPAYPEAARAAGIRGKVVLQAILDEDGFVPATIVLRTSGDLALDNAAVDAVRSRRYRPATVDGEAVKVYLNVVVGFDLDGTRKAASGEEARSAL